MTQHFDNELAKYESKDGLISTAYLEMIPQPEYLTLRPLYFRLKGHKEIVVYPSPEIFGLIEYLARHPRVWSLASIRVQRRQWDMRRLSIFGVNFRRAVEVVQREKFSKARFQLLCCLARKIKPESNTTIEAIQAGVRGRFLRFAALFFGR